MKIAAVTITYNRLDLTKQTIRSFYSKTDVDYHVFVDNGSNDGTQKYLKDFNHILLEKNYGIAYAFREAVRQLKGYDFILKLDNDIEVVTDDIIAKMLKFYELNGMMYACSPVDLELDRKFAPIRLSGATLKGYEASFTTHTGGAFQMIPYTVCEMLCNEYRHLQAGDYMIGKYYRRKFYRPTYLLDLQIRHIGLNQSCENYVL